VSYRVRKISHLGHSMTGDVLRTMNVCVEYLCIGQEDKLVTMRSRYKNNEDSSIP
jgi:hypothetical protein